MKKNLNQKPVELGSSPLFQPITYRKSRKAFIVEYSCSLILILLLLGTYFQKISIKPKITYFILGLSCLPLLSAEITRYLFKYCVTSDKLVVVEGLIKQAKQNIYFHPLGFVPYIDIHQNRIQRLLDYGTIHVVVDGGGNYIEIKDIDKPYEFMKILEKRIEENRDPRGKR